MGFERNMTSTSTAGHNASRQTWKFESLIPMSRVPSQRVSSESAMEANRLDSDAFGFLSHTYTVVPEMDRS